MNQKEVENHFHHSQLKKFLFSRSISFKSIRAYVAIVELYFGFKSNSMGSIKLNVNNLRSKIRELVEISLDNMVAGAN